MSQTEKKPVMNIHSKVGGFIREFRILNVDTGVERVIKGPKNRVVDNGLDMFGQNRAGLNSCWLSTNNTAVSDSETQISGTVAENGPGGIVSGGAQVSEPPFYAWKQIEYKFALGAATGVWSSICIGQDASANGLFARALILDGAGDPTTLTVEENEILTVVYQLRLYVPMTDRVVTVNVGSPPVPTEITCRTSHAGAWWGNHTSVVLSAYCYNSAVWKGSATLGGIDGSPSATGGGEAATPTLTRVTYIPGTYYVDHTLSAAYSVGNLAGGYGALNLDNMSGGNSSWFGPKGFQMSFNPPIAKDNTKNFAITVRHSWGRW